jgi:Dockerin type I domain
MRPKAKALLALVAALALGGGVAQAATNFELDVAAAIDAGLQYARLNGGFTSVTGGNGHLLLALLEKHSTPDFGSPIVGYSGLSASDKVLADASACILINDWTYGGSGGFYTYYDGQTLFALSVYGTTGGPDMPSACSSIGVRATIDKLVDRTVAQQATATPGWWETAGFWGYTGPGSDSSGTQYAIAGLAAAKGYYLGTGSDPGNRVANEIDPALTLASNGYKTWGIDASGGVFDTCGAQGCKGHGYNSQYSYDPSYQQTGSGAWVQLAGPGKNLNDSGVQGYLRWLQNAYNYQSNEPLSNWFPEFYLYYMWSSSKAYGIIENASVPPTPGNISTNDVGALPAKSDGGVNRLAHRNILTDVRVPVRGAGGAGYYGAEAGRVYPKWYYDYAYTIMTYQDAAGHFSNPQGTWGGADWADHGYAILVLERSIGGACVDTDGDGICDSEDRCPTDAANDCPKVRCDVNHDGKVNNLDISTINAHRGSTNPTDKAVYDINKNGIIDLNDSRMCVLVCDKANCAQ